MHQTAQVIVLTVAVGVRLELVLEFEPVLALFTSATTNIFSSDT